MLSSNLWALLIVQWELYRLSAMQKVLHLHNSLFIQALFFQMVRVRRTGYITDLRLNPPFPLQQLKNLGKGQRIQERKMS